MIRHTRTPRHGFQEIVREQGLVYETNADGTSYWKEDVYYSFTSREVDALYEAAKELHQMFLAAAGRVLEDKNGLTGLEIPTPLHDVIRRSWENEEWEFYGRFDLALDRNGVPKLLEYNADTPTGLLEAAIIQWYWKEEVYPRQDQFNSIHEGLTNRWKELIANRKIKKARTHFTSVKDHPEDRMTAGYVARTAEEAGLEAEYLSIDRIGWDRKQGSFVDEGGQPIEQVFKLYPWEWMGEEAFAPQLGLVRWTVLEPAWKAIFASKRLLLQLQDLYPDHPYLLKVSDRPLFGDYVVKPAFGREGSNVAVVRRAVEIDRREGRSDLGSPIYQEYCSLEQGFNDIQGQCGIWMAGPEPVGMGVREDVRPILGNTSQFVPHIIA